MPVVSLPTLYLCAAPIFATVGLVLLWRGLFRRRKGDAPHCRACGYNLTALTSDRCPECGSLIGPRSIVRGENRRSIRASCLGAGLTLAAIALCVPAARKVNWYTQLPAFVIMWEMESSQPSRAWSEMGRRLKANQLSLSQRRRWIEFCLREQERASKSRTNNVWVSAAINHLGSEFAAGQMNTAQRESFFAHMVGTQLRVRPRVIVGDPVPFELEIWSCAPDQPSTLSCRYQMNIIGKGHEPRWDYHAWSGRALFPSRTLTDVAAADHPGTNPLSVVLHWELLDPDGKRLDQRRFQCTSAFEAHAAEPPDFFKRVHDSNTDTALAGLITVGELLHASSGELSCSLSVRPTPVPIAFDVILRAGDREVPLGKLCRDRSARNDTGTLSKTLFARCELQPSVHCDLVLRGSSRAVRTTVDQYEYWDDELVLHDVPLIQLRSQSQPAAAAVVGF